MKDKFHNNDGSLTAYAFACGYVEHYPYDRFANNAVELYRDGCWHVTLKLNGKRVVWHSVDSLSEARKAYANGKQVVKFFDKNNPFDIV